MAKYIADMERSSVTTNTGTQTVAEALDRRGIVFDSVADMQAFPGLQVGAKVRTLGYYTPGDGGGNDYEIVAAGTGTDDGGSFIDLTGSGLQAKGLFVDGRIIVGQFGTRGGDASLTTAAINSALSFCKQEGVTAHWSGNYEINGSILSFWDVAHQGYGAIIREGEEWRIDTAESGDNKIFVSPTGSSNNDGLSPSEATSPYIAQLRIRRYRGDTSKGRFSIVFLDGDYTSRGVRIVNIPVMSNYLSFRAQNITTPPSVRWDGEGNAENSCILAQNSTNVTPIEIKGIEFLNWAHWVVVLENNARWSIEDCVVRDGASGFRVRGGRGTVLRTKFENMSSGVVAGYHAQSNVRYCEFVNISNTGTQYGRNSAGHTNNCTFDSCSVAVTAIYQSRVRTYNNVYTNCEIGVSVESSTWSDGSDQYEFSGKQRPWSMLNGSLNPLFQSTVSSNGMVSQFFSNARAGIVLDADAGFPTGGRELLSTFLRSEAASEGINYDFLRLPGLALYSPYTRIRVELDLSCTDTADMLIEVSAPGGAIGAVVSSLSIPPQGEDTTVSAFLEFTGSWEDSGHFKSRSGYASNVNTGAYGEARSFSTSALFRSKDTIVSPWRLYFTRNAGSMSLREVRTFVYY